MALQTFTAGQVLTAAQVTALQSNDFNQTVSTKTADYTLVAADKGTRVEMNSGSATTITVDTDLFNAGDTLFIQNRGAGVCTITAGTATVSTAGSLALVENAGGTLYFISAGVAVFYPSGVAAPSGGLTLIKTQTIGTTVSSVAVTDAFSADYDNYKITINGGAASGDIAIGMQLGATTTGYYGAITTATYSGAASPQGEANFSRWVRTGTGQTNSITHDMLLMSPFLTKNTMFTGSFVELITGGRAGFSSGYLNDSTSYTGFTIICNSGTLTGGTIRVYGYLNS